MYQISIGVLLSLVILLSTEKVASQSKIDSLKFLLEESENFETAYDLAYELFDVNNDEALHYSLMAFEIAKANGDSLQIVKSGRISGQLFRRTQDLNGSISILQGVLPIAKRNRFTREEKLILSALAIGYSFLANYDRALQYHFESLTILEKEGDKVQISNSLNNIGFVYFKLRNYNQALEYFNRSLDLRGTDTKDEDLSRLLINISLCHNQLSNFSKAQEGFHQAIEYCGDNCNNQILLEGEFGLGVCKFGQQRFDEALEHFEKSLSLAYEVGDNRFQAENLVYKGKIFIAKRQPSDAETALLKAEGLARAAQYNELLIDVYRQFSLLFNQSNDFKKAAYYQTRYIAVKDSIYNETLIKNLTKIQTDFAERENIKTIADNQAVIRQQRYLNVAIAIIAILAGLLILVLQRSNRVSKQVNAQLSEAKETIQQQNKLLEIKNKDLDREVEKKTADLERVNISLKQVNDELDNFIYKTSHDIRGPLASLKGMCNVALMDVTDEVALDYLRKLDATAERLNSILTRLLIINQINNSKLSVNRIDFNRIVNDIILLEKKKGLPSKIEIRKKINDDPSIFIQSDRELVRIVLENLIDNAIKFYNESDRVSSFVEINISSTGEGVKARVIDNGIGISESNPGKLFQMFFRASERSEIGGIGLYIVKTATSKIGGKVGLLTTPEGYTEFYVIFPPQPPSGDSWPAVQSTVAPMTATNPFLA